MSRALHRLRVLEAATALTLASAMLRLLPFRMVVRLIGTVESGRPAGATATNPIAVAVGRAVQAAARRLPWKPVCLPQALAASLMMRRRAIPSHLCLGVHRKDGAIAAHAWLVADGPSGGVVCGGAGAEQTVPIAALRSGLSA